MDLNNFFERESQLSIFHKDEYLEASLNLEESKNAISRIKDNYSDECAIIDANACIGSSLFVFLEGPSVDIVLSFE